MSINIHTLPITVYYEDTDAGGVVYYARYLAFAERARTEFLHAHGLSNTGLLAQASTLLVVSEVTAKYHAPARLEDRLVIETTVTGLKNASFSMQHVIKRGDSVLNTITVRIGCINAATGKPVRMPESLYAVLSSLLEP